LLLSISGGLDLTLWEVDEAANRVRQEVDPEANIIVGATLDPGLGDRMRVSIVASGMPAPTDALQASPNEAPTWTPKAALGPPNANSKDQFGRRLTDALTERGARGKARSGGKGNGGKARASASANGSANGSANASAEIVEEAQTVAEQPSAARTKGSGAAKKRPPAKTVRPPPLPHRIIREEVSYLERRAAPVVEGVRESGSHGWPEQWANGGDVAGNGDGAAHEVHTRPTQTRPNGAIAYASHQQQPDARRPTFFERLAGLVSTKNGD
jgi:hypothetical protein